MFDEVVLLEASGKAAGADARVCADDELFDAATALEAARALIDAAEAHVLAEIDARGCAEQQFGLVTTTWIARQAKLSRAVAKRRVVIAKALRSKLEIVDQALMEGRISFDHAVVLTDAVANPRVGEMVVAMAGELIAEADGMVFERWRDHVRSLVALLDQDGGYDPTVDPAANCLHYARTLDGVTHVKVTLTGVDAEATLQTLNSIADELFDRYTADHNQCPDIAVPARSQLLAEAMVEMARRSLAVDLSSSTPPEPEVTLVVNAEQPDTAFDPNGVRLQDGQVHRLRCDCSLHPIVVNSLGQPLDMGRKIRSANRAQRRAIAVRDGGCVFPGCGVTELAWLDMHHRIFWDDGGRTDVNLLCGLCRHHHNLVHRKHWRLSMHDDGWTWFTSPTGQQFWGQQHGKQRAGPTPTA